MNEPEDVVVDMRTINAPVVRVGQVVASETPARPTVRWNADSKPVTVKVGGDLRRVPYGGLRYLALVDPRLVEEVLQTRPAEVFLAALRSDTSSGKTDARRLKRILRECGLDLQLIDNGWKAVAKTFRDHPEVRFEEPGAYRAIRSAAASELGRTMRPESFRQPADTSEDADERQAPLPILAPEEMDDPLVDSPVQPRSGEDETDVDAFLRAAMARQAEELHDSEAFTSWVAGRSAVQAFEAALDRATSTDDLAGIVRFTERLHGHNSHFDPAVHGLKAVAVLRAADRTAKTIAVATRVVDELAGRIRKTGLGDIRPSRVAAAIAWLPWTAQGGRSGLIAALASKGINVGGREWWTGFDWNAMFDAGGGALGSVLRHEGVRTAITRKVLDDAIAAVDSRAALAKWLGAPSVVLELSDQSTAGARISDVVKQDEHLKRVFAALRRDSEVAELWKRAERAEAERDAARRSHATAEDEKAQLAADLDRIRRALDEATEADRTFRESERRQAKLDGMRSVAQMLATATTESATLEPDQLTWRLTSIAERAGVRPRGDLGSSIEFDPTWCESPGATLKPGDRCIVVRPAYEYLSEQENPVLLLKAVVRVE